MGDPMRRLEKVLAPLGRSCEFTAWGTLPPALPGLAVEGVGAVGLPVSEEDARRLIAAADQAPYGRGTETIVDTDVRRVWQIEPSRFALRNPGWQAQMEAIVTAVRQRFAIGGKVRHELYKLLVYEAGSFFAPHRDTEKTPGMFATLVVCLPSRHEGGTLVVEHEGESARIEFGGPDSEFVTAYAAFYSDCRHEITPVRSGYRVCLVYNLALDRSGPQPAAPRKAPAVAEAASALQKLFADPSLDLDKAVIPLEHQYTEAGLHPAALKGADRPRAEVLARAAASLDYECSLALVTHYQTGSVDLATWTPPHLRSRRSYRGYYGGRQEDAGSEDGADAEMDEVYEDSITLAHWLGMNGEERPFGTIHVDEEELLCGDDRVDWTVRQEIHEATGNEGAELKRWYRRCAVVLWPRDRTFRILAAEGQAVALPALERMAAGAADPDALPACRAFCAEILGHWRGRASPFSGPADGPERMLAVLEQIGTAELAGQFVRQVLPLDLTGREGAAVRRLCERFGWEALRPALTALIEQQRPARYESAPSRLLSLLAPLYEKTSTGSAEREAVRASLARDLDRALGRWGSQPAPAYVFDDQPPAGLVENAVRVFAVGSAPDALDRFLDRALRGELGCGLREVLTPDLKAIARWVPKAPAARPAYIRLREHCLAQLRAATREPVEPPADWRRDADLRCGCEDCGALARFLADPVAEVARFPLNKERRMHIHGQIERRECDCTHETERKGRPFTLVCRKTRASYERRERRYRQDRKLLEQIERLPDYQQV